MKKTNYAEFRRNQLTDLETRKEYEALEPEFEIAREIIALRRSRNLTQQQLANKMGTSQPAIARIESGSYRNVSLSFIRRIATALDAVPEIHLRKKSIHG